MKPLFAICLSAAAFAAEPPHHLHQNIDAYIQAMEEPSRAAWQKPDEVVRSLALEPGQTACDIGAGPGYFTLRLARAVGAGGRVFAVDVEPRMLAALRERLQKEKLTHITPVLAVADDPLLPDAVCDVVLIVDTYHHFPDGPAYLRALMKRLRPGGRIVNIDFHKRADVPYGPPLEHKIAREEFIRQAATAGLAPVADLPMLPYQYFIVMKPRAKP